VLADVVSRLIFSRHGMGMVWRATLLTTFYILCFITYGAFSDAWRNELNDFFSATDRLVDDLTSSFARDTKRTRLDPTRLRYSCD
jgi:hypothetical protein